MRIENYTVLNSKGNVSWKATAEKLFEMLNTEREPVPTGYLCPLCGDHEIMDYGSEFVCSNKDCKYDKTSDELFYAIASERNYTEKR
jgi:hypothetical protein